MVKKRGESRASVGEARSKVLGKAEKGVWEEKKEVKAAEQPAVEVVGAKGEMEELSMSWSVVMKNETPLEVDNSSGVVMDYFINNICLHDCPEEAIDLRAFVSLKYSNPLSHPEPITIPLATLSPSAPQTALQQVRFSSSDTLTLLVKIVGTGDVSKARVTICGEQIMHLTEQQIAALLM
eukprot:TRINITY_DN660_c5_g1_i1.p1 TRINITY_DN660_c5_g1~~TRINITY_DN660_c5_g1_i1.p1  ORF type:complete len:194 (+),score=55.14 TRINITY_DN660_c5_g1_i1:43-582(+)